MTSSTTYTAEDFERARFAAHPNGGLAMRNRSSELHAWTLGEWGRGRASDADLARSGWSPVCEASGEPETAWAHGYSKGRNDERDTPLSLDVLRTAWENAEVTNADNPVRKGDLMIYLKRGGFAVEPADSILEGQTYGSERVLSRAPQREAWADLLDVLGRYDLSAIECEGAGELARDLYADGVRVTGGDEK